MQTRVAEAQEQVPSSDAEQQAALDRQRAAMEADLGALKAEYTRLLQERSQLQGDVQVGSPARCCSRRASSCLCCWHAA